MSYLLKKKMPRGMLSIKWSMESFLDSRTSLEDCGIDKWQGELILWSSSNDLTDEEVAIGTIKCVKIANCDYLSPNDYEYVLDCHSSELQDLSLLFDKDTGYIKDDVRCDVGDRDEITQGCKLYISSLFVKPEFRGLGFGLYMVDEACRKINDSLSLTIICPSPLDDDGRPLGCGPQSQGACAKLRKHYALIGFAALGELFVARWKGCIATDLSQACPHLFK